MAARSRTRRRLDLGAVVVRATLERAKLPPDEVGTVVMGNVIQAGNKMNPARQAAIHGGVPVDVPAMTVNRVCGSGAQAIASAAQEIMLGFIDSAVAGGMENMDRAPYLMSSGRWGYRMGDGQIFDAMLMDGLNDAFSGQHSGWHTEDLARVAPDHARRAGPLGGAIAEAVFGSASRPASSQRKSHQSKSLREKVRPSSTRTSTTARTPRWKASPKLKPAFRKDGTITAGNAPGLNSGAAAMIVADRAWAEKKGLKPMARLVAYGIGAVEPGMFGLGPVPAVRQALDRAGWKIADIQRIEINEAFAAIAIAVTKDLGFASGHRQCGRWRHRTWPPDRRDGSGAHDASFAFNATRRDQQGNRHALHRGRAGDRACVGTSCLRANG